ncbi:MAG: DUF4118 domain-containing protein, partial [Mycobacterium sp.]|nr:DUF4118 domain-containing protein [Mycobacterium sp.]
MSSLLVRPTRPPLWCGVVVAAALIAAETVVVVLLKHLAPTMAFGVVFLLGVLVIAMGWGFGLAAITAIFSAFAFNFCRNWPHPSVGLTQLQDWVVIAVFVIVALLCNALAGLARARAVEAEQRRREADLAAELARRMLRAGDLHSALDSAAECLTLHFQLPWAQFELEAVPGDEDRFAFALHDGATAIGTLLVPSDLS